MEHKKILDKEKHEINPFIYNVLEFIKKKGSHKKIYSKRMSVVDNSTGEVNEGYQMIYTNDAHDVQAYLKVYSVSSLLDLTHPEQKTFRYMLKNIRMNEDKVVFSLLDCQKDSGYKSKQLINTALCGLIDKKLIARTLNKHEYYINPTILFNGDRVKFIKKYAEKN